MGTQDENEIATLARFYYDRHPGLSTPSGPSKSWPIKTLVDVAALLDDTVTECYDERGCYGAASARAQIGFDDSTFEDIHDQTHPAVTNLPTGRPKDVRKAILSRDGETVWDGNNHVPQATHHLRELLAEMRTGAILQ